MEQENIYKQFAKDIESVVRADLGQTLETYGYDLDMVFTASKWKPLVLIIGNYSSGKSTFINELVGAEIQRTGQAPTDDSFTIITSTEGSEVESETKGSAIINDPSLPFESLRKFGEKFISHFQLKRIQNDKIRELAVIDSPGMLDSVTEKDRGYDYLGAIGEIASMSDLIILMFDPHKAGTIKEAYEVIRSTLPVTVGEERIVYVLNRIDECDNLADLVKSYGTLTWNLSQMTGRKDIPRIFLTFSPERARQNETLGIWAKERDELKAAIFSAPRMRLNHILQHVDRELRAFGLLLEAMAVFKQNFWQKMLYLGKITFLASVIAFFFADLLLKLITGYPDMPFVISLLTGELNPGAILTSAAFAILPIGLASVYVHRLFWPKYVKLMLCNLESLVTLDTAYKKDLWKKVKAKVEALITSQAGRQIWLSHTKNQKKNETLIRKKMSVFYDRIKSI